MPKAKDKKSKRSKKTEGDRGGGEHHLPLRAPIHAPVIATIDNVKSDASDTPEAVVLSKTVTAKISDLLEQRKKIDEQLVHLGFVDPIAVGFFKKMWQDWLKY